MKIKNIVIFLLIIVFIIIFPTIYFFLSNWSFNSAGNFIFSNNMNKKLEKIFPKNELLKLKKGDFYYRLQEFEKALQSYSQVNCKKPKDCLILYHNIGNTFYKLGENNNNTELKITYWQKSVLNYQKALTYEFDEQTKFNLEFVLKKLSEFKKEEEKPSPSAPLPEGEGSKDKKEEQIIPKGESMKISPEEEKAKKPLTKKEEQIIPKGESMKISPEEEKAKKPLTEEEKQDIEEYLKLLQQEEKQNINLNKPKKNQDIFDILNDDFFFDGFDKNENDW